MKKILLVCLFFLIVQYSHAQLTQFANIPNDTLGNSMVYNSIETASNYFFLAMKDNNANYTLSSQVKIYKTNKTGVILDSFIVTSPNKDSTFMGDFFLMDDGTIGLYLLRCYFPTNPVPATGYEFFDTRFYYYHLDTNFNVLQLSGSAYTDTTKINNLYRVKKIGDKIIFMLNEKLIGLNNFLCVTDLQGNYLYNKHLLNVGEVFTDGIELTPNKYLFGLTYGFYHHIITDSNFNIVKITTDSNRFSIDNAISNLSTNSFLDVDIVYNSTTTMDSAVAIKYDTSLVSITNKILMRPINASNFITPKTHSGMLSYVYPEIIYTGTLYNLDPLLKNITLNVLVNMDSNLNIRWQKVFADNYPCLIYRYVATSDSGCFLLGRYNNSLTPTNPATRSIEPLILKINSAGIVTHLFSFSKHKPLVLLSPNPATTTLNVLIENNLLHATFSIYTIQGQLVQQKQLNTIENQIDISSLPHSNYIYILHTPKGERSSGKFTKK